MSNIFNYNTLDVQLNPTTKSITVLLNRPQKNNAINSEMLFELETFLNWLSLHNEVNSVVFSCHGDYFSSGLDQEEIYQGNLEKMQLMLKRLQKITYGLLHLPQTIIFDLKEGAKAEALEFSLGADLRLAQSSCILQFDHLMRGQTPGCGGAFLLPKLVGQSVSKKWIFSSKKLYSDEIEKSGLINFLYKYDENTLEDLVTNISKQSAAARIQMKRSSLMDILDNLEEKMQEEFEMANGALMAGDWKTYSNSIVNGDQCEFINSKEYGEIVKKVVSQSNKVV